MNKLVTQILDTSSESYTEQSELPCMEKAEYKEIRNVLVQLQSGYTNRDIEKVDAFVEELFVSKKDTYILGTGTGELFFGKEQIKRIFEDDWKYWGDVDLNLEDVDINVENETAWFSTVGTVKFTFEDTPERNNNYVGFIKKKIEEPGLTSKQKITFINWVLSLTYYQRFDKRREYLIPLRLSGVLIKEDKWKFAHLKFSLPKGDFPDERFESSREFLESYNNQNAIVEKCYDTNLSSELSELLKSLEIGLFGQKDISIETLNKFFVAEGNPYIIAPENKKYMGIDQIKEFFNSTANSILSLDLNHVISNESNGVIWTTVCGTIKQSLTEDELAARVLDELGSLFDTNASSNEKLFIAHRSISSVLKESSIGESYTCPIRLSAVVLKQKQGLAFQNIHFSFPSYWVLEGKIDCK